MNTKIQEKLKNLPSVDVLLHEPVVIDMTGRYPRTDVVNSLRRSLELERESILAGENPGEPEEMLSRIISMAGILAAKMNQPSLCRVINATGIMNHTNLGRAILSEEAVKLVNEVAVNYTNLEFDLEQGERGTRMAHLKQHLMTLTGAEDVLVVNNNAAAVFLLLDTFARGKEVVVSRGELIEIGGSFRLPDILKKSGAVLVEAGCTNKTYLKDYENAVTENTAILMKSHKSNFSIHGFTHDVTGPEIASLAKKLGIISVEDMGSGLMIGLEKYGLHGEPTCRELIEAGLDLVTFSGDKMLGGPQCGIILGRKSLVRQLAGNPLTRTLRLDKMTIAALEGTLILYRDPEMLEEKLPFLKMLSQGAGEICERTNRVKRSLEENTGLVDTFHVVEGYSKIGGGAYPDAEIAGFLLQIKRDGLDYNKLYNKLLGGNPPVIGRIYKESLVFDLRTVLPDDEGDFTRRLTEIFKDEYYG